MTIKLVWNHSKGIDYYLSLMPETYEHEITFERTSKYFVDADTASKFRLPSSHLDRTNQTVLDCLKLSLAVLC